MNKWVTPRAVRAGDVVPADARVIDAHRLACDEAPLTGESEPQTKVTGPVPEQAPLAERRSIVYAGTAVVAGRGRVLVVATGPNTEVAHIRDLIETQTEPEAPLAVRMSQLGRRATAVGLGSAGLVLVFGLIRGRPVLALIRGAVALAVAAIPEGLPVVTTAALVRSMARMREKGMIVRKVSAAETLGGVTIVCVDKTGTLTANEMRVEAVDLDGDVITPEALRANTADPLGDRLSRLLTAALLNSDVDFHHNGSGEVEITGSATERALVLAARKAGLDAADLRTRYPRCTLHERSGSHHYVISVHEGPEGPLAFVKGAPEQVARLCAASPAAAEDERKMTAIMARNQQMAGDGQRVLALAWRRLAPGEDTRAGGHFEYLGLIGLRDPLRPGSADAVRAAARAGIRTIVLTGDQNATAAAIAREIGLNGKALDADALAAQLDADDPHALDDVAVLSRVTPAGKVAIVRALRRRGEIVAMAGDGINDAPALKAADIGIAVGERASEIARQTADLVLQQADLRSILQAVSEGRVVQDNLRRAVRYLFATNLSEVALMVAGAAVGREPLSALHLLWVNIVTDTFPGLALALEPASDGVLSRPPAPPSEPILPPSAWRRVIRDGSIMGAAGGIAALLGGPGVTLASLTGAQLGYAFVCRAQDAPARNRFGALVGTGIALQMGAFLFPPLRAALRLPPPSLLPLVLFGASVGAPLLARRLARSSLFPSPGSEKKE